VTMSRGYWATFVDCHFDASCSKSKAEAVEAVGLRALGDLAGGLMTTCRSTPPRDEMSRGKRAPEAICAARGGLRPRGRLGVAGVLPQEGAYI
jgi:hypothetical protein